MTKQKVSVPVEASCPACSTKLTIPLKLNKEQPRVIEKVQEATGVSLGVLGVYAFDGSCVCEKCGKFVIASLTVSAHEKANSLD